VRQTTGAPEEILSQISGPNSCSLLEQSTTKKKKKKEESTTKKITLRNTGREVQIGAKFEFFGYAGKREFGHTVPNAKTDYFC